VCSWRGGGACKRKKKKEKSRKARRSENTSATSRQNVSRYSYKEKNKSSTTLRIEN